LLWCYAAAGSLTFTVQQMALVNSVTGIARSATGWTCCDWFTQLYICHRAAGMHDHVLRVHSERDRVVGKLVNDGTAVAVMLEDAAAAVM